MANNTIYPYGTNGELPAGIAIVNDLTTGGADKALSAQQGVVLKGMIAKSSYAFETRFQVSCEVAHTQQTNWSNVSKDTISTPTSYLDNCVLYLPSQYTETGTPTKLVIYCRHGNARIGQTSATDYNLGSHSYGNPVLGTTNNNCPLPIPYLISLGYAVVAANGVPDEWIYSLGLGPETVTGSNATYGNLYTFGAYTGVVATRKAYDYVTENYNIDKNGCYILGYSQGGMYAQNVIDLSDIPILAAAEMSPSCSMHYHQWDSYRANALTIGDYSTHRTCRLMVSKMLGFAPSTIDDASIEALTWDSVKDKIMGYDPWTRNIANEFTHFTPGSYTPEGGTPLVDTPYTFESGYTVDDVDMVKYSKCPLKVWCGANDTTLSPSIMKAFVKAIKNGGGVADIVIYTSGDHSFFTEQTTLGNVNVNGVSYPYKPVAVDIATWFRSFGGY